MMRVVNLVAMALKIVTVLLEHFPKPFGFVASDNQMSRSPDKGNPHFRLEIHGAFHLLDRYNLVSVDHYSIAYLYQHVHSPFIVKQSVRYTEVL